MANTDPATRVATDDLAVLAETDDFVVVKYEGLFYVLKAHEDGEDEYVLPFGPAEAIPRSDWVELMIEVAYNAQDDDQFKQLLSHLPQVAGNPRLWLVKKGSKPSKAHSDNRARLVAPLSGKFTPEGVSFSDAVLDDNRLVDDGKRILLTAPDGKSAAAFRPDTLFTCALRTLADPRMQTEAPEQFAPFVLASLPASAAPIAPATRLRATVISPPAPQPPAALPATTPRPAVPVTLVPAARPDLPPVRVIAPQAPIARPALVASASVPALPHDADHRVWVGSAREHFRRIVAETVEAGSA